MSPALQPLETEKKRYEWTDAAEDRVSAMEAAGAADLDPSIQPQRHLPGAEPSEAVDQDFLEGLPIDIPANRMNSDGGFDGDLSQSP